MRAAERTRRGRNVGMVAGVPGWRERLSSPDYGMATGSGCGLMQR